MPAACGDTTRVQAGRSQFAVARLIGWLVWIGSNVDRTSRAGIQRLLGGLWDYLLQAASPGPIELAGDSASGRAYVLSFGDMRDGGSHLNYSVYHDRYRRTPEGWKFAERVDEVKYLDTTPLAGSPPRQAHASTAGS